MPRRPGFLLVLALAASAGLARPARADEDRSAKGRLDELERKADEQARELDRLRTQRMADELRGAPDAPPHVDRSGDAKGDLFDWGYDDGFFVKGTVGAASYVFRPRAYVQLDYRASLHSRSNLGEPTKGVFEDRFLLRRAVVGFVGTFGPIGFFFEAEPVRGTNGVLPIQNMWLEWRSFDELQLRAGHFIPPFTFGDAFTAPPFLDFLEQPMVVQALSYSFRPGAMLHGSFERGLLEWFLSLNNELDANGTITGDPIVTARLSSDTGALSFGVAGSWERLGGPTHSSVQGITPGQFRFFAPVAVRGWQQRYEVDAQLDAGPFFASAEYAWCVQRRDRANADASDGTPLVAQGAYATVGWMFLGPPRDSKRPHTPFADWSFSLDLEKKRNARNVGAEVVLRAEWLTIDQARGGRDFRGGDARAIEVGINVYPMENVKLMLEYAHVHVGDQAHAERAHSREADELMARAQLEF